MALPFLWKSEGPVQAIASRQSLINCSKKSLLLKILYAMLDKANRGVAQLGSALLWGSRGRGFKSRRSDR